MTTDVIVIPINQLPSAASVGVADLIPILQGGVTKSATPNLLPFVSSGTGAVAESVQQTLRRIIYPEQYTTFQGAATAAIGAILKLTPGTTYTISNINIGAGTTVDMTGATVKLTVLGALVGSPIFNVTGAKVTFIGGDVDGQKASQPADGFSDSFNTGANSTGRAYRSAIKADAVVNPTVTDLTVLGVRFLNTYGACVATLDVPVVRVQNCKAKTCNFELAFLYRSAGTNTDAMVTGNVIDTPASGDGAVNANGATITGYRRVKFADNIVYNSERCMVKIESPASNISVSDNVHDTNTVSTYPTIQIDTTSGTSRVVVSGNTSFNVQRGIALSGGGATLNCVVSGNSVYTTTGATIADGFASDGTITNLVVSDNTFADIKRHGMIITGTVTRGKITGNVLAGQASAGQQAMSFSNSGGSWGTLTISDNTGENFEQSAVGSGVCAFAQTGANTIALLSMTGNTFDAGADANRCLRLPDASVVTAGKLSDNYLRGQLEHYSSGIDTRHNVVTGTVTIPALTFTPALKFGGASVGLTYSTQIGRYRRDGNRIYFQIYIVLTAKGSSSGAATITGMPVATVNITNDYATCLIYAQSLTYAGTPLVLFGVNSTSMDIVDQRSATGYTTLSDTAFANNTALAISGTYEVSDNG